MIILLLLEDRIETAQVAACSGADLSVPVGWHSMSSDACMYRYVPVVVSPSFLTVFVKGRGLDCVVGKGWICLHRHLIFVFVYDRLYKNFISGSVQIFVS